MFLFNLEDLKGAHVLGFIKYRSCDFRGCTLKYLVIFLVSCLAAGQNSMCDLSGLIIGNSQPLFSSPSSWESVLPTSEPAYCSFLEGVAANGHLRLPYSEAYLYCQSRPFQLKSFLSSGTLVEALSKDSTKTSLMGALPRVLFYVSVPFKSSSPDSHPAGPGGIHRETEESFVLVSSAPNSSRTMLHPLDTRMVPFCGGKGNTLIYAYALSQ